MDAIVVSNEILLAQIGPNDAPVIFRAIDTNREFLGRWLPFVATTHAIGDSEAFIQAVASNRDETLDEVFTIWFRGDFAGVIGFHNTDKLNKKTEVGYWLVQKMTGRGIITASCRELLGIAFEKMGMKRVAIKCATENLPSEKVALRLGFSFEGTERAGERYGDVFFDLKVFSLLKGEW